MINKLENIKFEYEDGANPDKTREAFMERNLLMWFSQYITQLNNEKVITEVYLKKDGNNHISFSNINDDFMRLLLKHMKTFEVPNSNTNL